MCGIVGTITESPPRELGWIERAEKVLSLQLKSLRHRGPDGFGSYVESGIALGHSRLSIIDLSTGRQPMSTPDGLLTIVFNGEIYNYLELRKELEGQGAQFYTRSDTEVLLLGYRIWGPEVVNRLNGMYAFAIYHRKDHKLFCARDPFGQKPFFYTQENGNFHFASETRAFASLPGFSKAVEARSIEHFLAFESFYGDESIYSCVKKLPPGHFCLFENGKLTIGRHFRSIPSNHSSFGRKFSESVNALDEDMNRAVALSCRADVPVSMLLSGGLDSSLVLAYFRKNFPDQGIRAFHVQVQDPTYDESAFAKQAARHLGVKLDIFGMDLKQLAELASSVPALLDEPQADPGILPKYFICNAISKSFKVALTGDGGDELFYGYLIMKAAQIARTYRYVPGWLHKSVLAPLAARLPARGGYMSSDFLAKRFMRGFPSAESLRGFRWMGSFSESDLYDLLQPHAKSGDGLLSGFNFLNEVYADASNAAPLGRFAYSLQKTFLPDFVLCNSDRASMLNSLELRSPLLDMNLAIQANAIKDRDKLRGFSTKYVMKKIAERHLPMDLIYRKKIGFTVPIAELLRTHLRPELEEIFGEKRLREQGLFRPAAIRDLLDRHFTGKQNLYKPIWTLYSLQKWLFADKVAVRGT